MINVQPPPEMNITHIKTGSTSHTVGLDGLTNIDIRYNIESIPVWFILTYADDVRGAYIPTHNVRLFLAEERPNEY